eukprot:scaffold15662_cov22-Tisochrysis_lutea.AAC.1
MRGRCSAYSLISKPSCVALMRKPLTWTSCSSGSHGNVCRILCGASHACSCSTGINPASCTWLLASHASQLVGLNCGC